MLLGIHAESCLRNSPVAVLYAYCPGIAWIPALHSTALQVCELDLVFNFNKVYGILDEFICGGELLETSQLVILQRLHDADKLIEKS